MVDAYSKKLWTALMNTDTTTNKTLAVLYGWFCSETGMPTTLVSDNSPQFTAKEFGVKCHYGELSMYFHHHIIRVAMARPSERYNFVKID